MPDAGLASPPLQCLKIHPPAGGSRAVSGEVQFFERPFLKPFLIIDLFEPVLLILFHIDNLISPLK
jgi:hypothetical protein